MNQPNRLRWTLNVVGIYLTVLGVLFLFLPGVAESAFSISLTDPALTPLYGTVLLVLALTAYLVAQDVEKYARLVWVFIFESATHVLVFIYLLVSGIQTFTQAGPPLIVSVIFLVLLLLFRR
jgi:hypothetical protein